MLKNDLLPAIIRWMEDNGHPLHFLTEASVNLADDEELMENFRSEMFHDRVYVLTPEGRVIDLPEGGTLRIGPPGGFVPYRGPVRIGCRV